MINAISIDLEDWFCAYNLRIDIKDWDKQELRVEENTHRLLNILDKYNTKATFFVLGWIAEKVPGLITEIETAGHEIGVHGYSHTLITKMTPQQFEDDLIRALNIISLAVKNPVIGFRAPSFTIIKKTLWALDILKKNNIKYDSSIYPVGFHPDYGIYDVPLQIHNIGQIIEVPMSVAEISGKRIPCSGGGYFRIFPYAVMKYLMKKCNEQGRPVIFYLHPWEVDPGQPRMNLPLTKKFRHYYNLDKTAHRLEKLLTDFIFAPIREVLNL
ncbi:MAG: XrtA system polysaccharide deacetylase [Ignavibacteriaceae bacterium]